MNQEQASHVLRDLVRELRSVRSKLDELSTGEPPQSCVESIAKVSAKARGLLRFARRTAFDQLEIVRRARRAREAWRYPWRDLADHDFTPTPLVDERQLIEIPVARAAAAATRRGTIAMNRDEFKVYVRDVSDDLLYVGSWLQIVEHLIREFPPIQDLAARMEQIRRAARQIHGLAHDLASRQLAETKEVAVHE